MKNPLILSDFTQLTIEGFNGVGGINHLTYSLGALQENHQIIPVSVPRFSNLRILLAPLRIKGF